MIPIRGGIKRKFSLLLFKEEAAIFLASIGVYLGCPRSGGADSCKV